MYILKELAFVILTDFVTQINGERPLSCCMPSRLRRIRGVILKILLLLLLLLVLLLLLLTFIMILVYSIINNIILLLLLLFSLLLLFIFYYYYYYLKMSPLVERRCRSTKEV